MKGVDILRRYLTHEEEEKFRINTSKSCNFWVCEEEWSSSEDVIDRGFLWMDTPEGHDYWNNIHVRVVYGNDLVKPIKHIKKHKI